MYKKGIYEIRSNEPLPDAVWRMVLEGDTQWITAPGQFVNIALEGRYLRRPISVCDYDAGTLTLVYKVGGRMYAFADMVDFHRVALKCDPDEALQLRERYPREITPAYHANKRLWNDVRTTGDLPDAFIREQIRNSYLLVLRQNVTPRALRDELLAYVEAHGIPEK